MTSKQRILLLALALLLLGGLAAGARWLLGDVEVAAVEAPSAPRPDPVRVDETAETARAGVTVDVPSDAPVETTVAYPLEIELELERAAAAPTAKGVAPPGSAATARLVGSIFGTRDQGIRAEVRFLHGANQDRVLACDAEGAFGASDLYPGLSIVEVTGPGVIGSLREILLRQDRETTLNIGYSQPATVTGRVLDRVGDPIPAAIVSVDGQEATTDDLGTFVVPRVAAGEVLVVIRKAGFRAYREKLNVTAGSTIEPGRLEYALEPGATLDVSVPERIGGPGEAFLLLLPELGAQRDFPWFLVNPVRVWPGGRARVEDLPAGRLELRLFHAGAIAKPTLKVVNLNAGQVTSAEIHLEPGPMLTGVVRRSGRPVAGARVTLEAPDRVGATLAAVGEVYGFVESEVLPTLPPAAQQTVSDAEGEFVLSAYEEVAKSRYLTAVGPDGKTSGGRVLRGGEHEVAIELAAPLGEAELAIELPGRFQPLPVQIRVDGAPRDPELLPPDRELVIGGLAPGTWKLSARWDEDVIVEDRELEVDGEASLVLELPAGAISGQPLEMRQRAGKR